MRIPAQHQGSGRRGCGAVPVAEPTAMRGASLTTARVVAINHRGLLRGHGSGERRGDDH